MATDTQASYRGTREVFEMEETLIISRGQLATSDGENWKKIFANFDTVELLASQSAVPDAESKPRGEGHVPGHVNDRSYEWKR